MACAPQNNSSTTSRADLVAAIDAMGDVPSALQTDLFAITPNLGTQVALSQADILRELATRKLGDAHPFHGLIDLVASDPLLYVENLGAVHAAASRAVAALDNAKLSGTPAYLEAREALAYADMQMDDAQAETTLAALSNLLTDKTEAGATPLALSEIQFLIARHYYSHSDFPASDAALVQALELSSEFDPSAPWEPASRVSQLTQASTNAHDQGDSKTAIARAEEALSLLRTYADEMHPWIGEAYSVYASEAKPS